MYSDQVSEILLGQPGPCPKLANTRAESPQVALSHSPSLRLVMTMGLQTMSSAADAVADEISGKSACPDPRGGRLIRAVFGAIIVAGRGAAGTRALAGAGWGIFPRA